MLSHPARLSRSPRFTFSGAAVIVFAGLTVAGCATVPPPRVQPATFEQKMSWILSLEDRRMLRETPPAPPDVPMPRHRAAAAVLPGPDLLVLLADEEARIRRRAALAIGRVGLPEAVPRLVAVLEDPDPEVRQMAAFALGLLGDRSAAEPLRRALRDSSPVVQGRAAEAIGAMGDQDSASAIGEMVAAQLRNGALAGIAPDEMAPEDPAAQAFQLGVYALARLKSYETLAAAVVGPGGEPRTAWWPAAYALQRVEDRRAAPVLVRLARMDSAIGRGFAARGLGVLKDPSGVEVLLPMAGAWQADPHGSVMAVRALGQIGDRRAVTALLPLLQPAVHPSVRLEAVGALGALNAEPAIDALLDLFAEPSPPLRAAALRAVSAIDREQFLMALSGMDPDRHWSVRAALASTLASLDADLAMPRLTQMLGDTDLRVIPSVLSALVRVKAPGVEQVLLEHLQSDDAVVRMSAASNLGQLRPAAGAQALANAYAFGERDLTYVARAAALDALSRYGAEAATPTLERALSDRDWAVRVRAASLLKGLDGAGDPGAAIRPAPTARGADGYRAPELVNPSVSPHAYIETDLGTIEIELSVLDAPLTVHNFITLARRGFYNGLSVHRVVPAFVVQGGDPRGDGEGGPGYTIRDEVNQRPYLRGTVGMALDWADTGGSQFFITHTPQPHLDGRYTVFGHVVSGMEVVDRMQQWDVIRQVKVWDGTEPAIAAGGGK
jgi:cyclophilin family peptidyl-prolyl cis-trans isomerase/HEAT repeat protein